MWCSWRQDLTNFYGTRPDLIRPPAFLAGLFCAGEMMAVATSPLIRPALYVFLLIIAVATSQNTMIAAFTRGCSWRAQLQTVVFATLTHGRLMTFLAILSSTALVLDYAQMAITTAQAGYLHQPLPFEPSDTIFLSALIVMWQAVTGHTQAVCIGLNKTDSQDAAHLIRSHARGLFRVALILTGASLVIIAFLVALVGPFWGSALARTIMAFITISVMPVWYLVHAMGTPPAKHQKQSDAILKATFQGDA